ncbi:MAG: nitroreductase family protein [Bacteroidales bacterium]|nr:nitroreductase family protein [Bacteroidales bacterium]
MEKPFSSFLELVNQRYSVRSFNSNPVDDELIKQCLRAAHLAPSACNAQPWKFIVVNDPILKNQLADATSKHIVPMNHFTKQAPVHVVVILEKPNLTSAIGSVIQNKPYTLIDIGIATAHFCLQATALGLGTCIIGWFDEKKVRKLLQIPPFSRPVLIIALGYPEKPDVPAKHRKPFENIFNYNKY